MQTKKEYRTSFIVRKCWINKYSEYVIIIYVPEEQLTKIQVRTYLVHVRVPHLGDELDGRGRVGVVMGELHHRLLRYKTTLRKSPISNVRWRTVAYPELVSL